MSILQGRRVETEGRPSATADIDEVGLPARSRWVRRLQVLGVQLALIAAFLLAWQFGSGRFVDAFLVSTPLEVADRLGEWLSDGSLLFHAMSTLSSAGLGFLVGGSLAVVLGYIVGTSKFLAQVFEPIITALFAMPRIAIVPVLIVWVGIGAPLAVTLSAILVFFLMFYNVFYGVRDASVRLTEAIKVMGGKRRHIARRVRLPSALVWIVAGLKISMPQAFVGAVTAEILASNRGLGYLVAVHAGRFDVAGAFAALVTLLVAGFLLDRAVTLASARALAWKS